MFGLSEKGFKRKRYPEVLESMEKNAKDLFGENVNLSERSPLGLFLKVLAFPIAKLWELAEKVYYSAFIDYAEGVGVDRVAKNIAVTRLPARHSSGIVIIYGIPETRVPEGFRVATKGGIMFETLEDCIVQEDGQVAVKVQSIETGFQTNVPAGTIVSIVNPISGIEAVNNPEATLGGADIETDEEFRNRYDRSLAAGGSSTRESIEAALLELPGVSDAIVEGNETMDEINGIPPKSIAPFVYGGNDDDIAETILRSKAFGIQSYGSIVRNVRDSRGNLHKIGFSRPTSIDIYVKITLITNELFKPQDKNAIKTAIIQYIGGEDADGTIYKGLGVGDSVVYTKLIGYCHIVNGINDVIVQVSKDGTNWTQQNIAVGAMKIPKTDYNKIIIN